MNDLNALIAEYADVSSPDGEPICVWERVSTDMKRQEILAQTKDLKRFIKAGLYRVVKVFRFQASAYHGRHLGQQAEMLADVEAGLYKTIVAAMTSRYERQGVKPALRLALDLDLYGARVLAIDDPRYGDMSDEIGIISTVLKAKQDQAYSASISDNVNREFRLMDEQNMFRNAIPAGYTTTGGRREKKLVPHPFAAEVVAQAFRDFPARGMSTTKLARTFEAANTRYNTDLPEGARNLRLPETHQGVAAMLRREVYSTGRYQVQRQDGTVYTYHGPPLIGVREQQAAIAALEARKTGDAAATRAIAKDDYSGAIWCPEHADEKIGRGYRIYTGGNPHKGRPTYQVRKRERRYYFKCCKKTISADKADQAIEEKMGSNPTPWWVPAPLDPNAERDQKLEIIRRELEELPALGLDEDAEDACREELRAERKRLRDIPDQDAVTYGKQKTDALGKPLTLGDMWRMMTPTEKRDHLTSGNFCVLVESVPVPGQKAGRVEATIDYLGDDDEDDSDLVA